MNILVLFTFDISLKMWSEQGLIDREFKIYREIQKKEPSIKYTFLTYGNEEDLKVQSDNNLDEFTIYPIYNYMKKSNSSFINILKSIIFAYKIKNKFNKEFTIVKTNQLMGSWVGIILKIISKSGLYVRTGFSPYLFAKYENKTKFKIFVYKLLTTLSIKYSDLYSVSSKSEFNALNKLLKIQNKKIVIRSNWVSNQKYISLKNRYNKSILSVGRLEDQKNYLNLIDQLENSKYELNIVGTGSLEKFLIDYANQKKVKLNLIGNLKNNDLLEIYQKYKFYVLPSLYEGNSKSLKEAMAAGCIPIVNDIESVYEIIKHEENGLILNFKRDSLVDELDILNKENKVSEILSLKSYDSAKNFSLEKAAEKELGDYNKILVT